MHGGKALSKLGMTKQLCSSLGLTSTNETILECKYMFKLGLNRQLCDPVVGLNKQLCELRLNNRVLCLWS